MASLAEFRAKYPQYDDMTDEQLADAFHKKFYADMPREEFNAKIGYKDVPTRYEEAAKSGKSFQDAWIGDQGKAIDAGRKKAEAANAAQAAQYDGSMFSAATEGSQAGLMGGWDDEIAAGMLAPIEAGKSYMKGDGFNLGDTYARLRDEFDARKASRRAAFPGSSLAGETLGGLALGGTLSKNGITTSGKDLPVGPGIAATGEGAAYGALYGAGEAKPGERVQGAATGAIVGGLTGAAAHQFGKFVNQVGSKVEGPTSQELKTGSQQMFDVGETSGVELRPEASGKLKQRMELAVGKVGRRQPETANFLADLEDTFNGATTLEDFETFRQDLGAAMKNADPKDKRSLLAMKRIMDDVTTNPSPQDWFHPDDMYGVEAVNKARELWARGKATEVVERIMDNADRKGTGLYTQSGLANAIRKEMETLYSQIQKGTVRGFSQAQVAMIRQMAKGGDASTMLRIFSTFAPRGPVSIGLGQVVGSMFPGGQYVMPVAGQAAAIARDQAARSNLEALLNSVSTGQNPVMPSTLPNKAHPFIGGGVAAVENLLGQLFPSLPAPSPTPQPAR